MLQGGSVGKSIRMGEGRQVAQTKQVCFMSWFKSCLEFRFKFRVSLFLSPVLSLVWSVVVSLFIILLLTHRVSAPSGKITLIWSCVVSFGVSLAPSVALSRRRSLFVIIFLTQCVKKSIVGLSLFFSLPWRFAARLAACLVLILFRRLVLSRVGINSLSLSPKSRPICCLKSVS